MDVRKKFSEIIIKRHTEYSSDTMKFEAHIPGVNSGVYTPKLAMRATVVKKRWWGTRVAVGKMYLNMQEIRMLKEECEKILEYYDNMMTG
jgi:hypothetical protein